MPAPTPKHILFLDDDPDFLELLDSLTPATVRDRWRVHRTTDPAKALVILRVEPIELVVTDLNMPVMDGLQFLRLLHQVCPLPRKVVLTSVPDEDYREVCLRQGASLYLTKPPSAAGFEDMFRLLDELLAWPTEGGFSGVLRRVPLADVIQLECLSGASSVVRIAAPGIAGRIHIRSGRILHAEAEGRTGPEALTQLVGLQSGEYIVTAFEEPEACTIQENGENRLLDAPQKPDERLPSTPRTENALLSHMSLQAQAVWRPSYTPRPR